MTNPILYDFKKTITSKYVMFVILVFILFGALFVSSAMQRTPGGGIQVQGVDSVNTPLWVYYTGHGYNFLGYAFDTYGAPITGVNYSVTAYVGTAAYKAGDLTNSSGYASFDLKVPASSGVGVSVTITLPSSIADEQNNGQPQTFQGQLQSYNSQFNTQSFNMPATAVVDPSNATKIEMSITELGANGAPPSNWGVYYKYVAAPPSQQTMQQMTESQMQLLGSLNGVQAVLPMPAVPSGMSDIIVGIFTADGQQVSVSSYVVQQLTQNLVPSCQRNCQNPSLWEYPTASGYNFLGYAFDVHGAPVAGVNYSVTLSVGNGTYNGGGLTNSSGYAAFDIEAPTENGAGMQASATFPGQQQGQGWSTQGQLQPYNSQNKQQFNTQSFSTPVTAVVDPSNATKIEMSITELGANGAPPSNWGVYYKYVAAPPSQQTMQQMTESQMQLLGSLNGVQAVLPMPAVPSGMSDIIVGIFTADGQQVSTSWYTVQQLTQNLVPSCQRNCQNPSLWEYPTASGYNFLGYAFDVHGAPVAGVNYSVTLSVGNGTYNGGGLTNSSGYAAFDIEAPTENGAGMQASATFPGQQQGQGWSTQGQLQPYNSQNSGPQTLGKAGSAAIVNPSNTTSLEMVVMQLGPNGTKPASLGIYYKYVATVLSQQEVQQMTESQMQLLGHLSGILTVLPMPPTPPNNTQSMITGIFTPDGKLVSASYGAPPQVTVPSQSITLVTALLPNLVFVTPIVGLLAAFSAYSAQRVSGVLDSVLTRPVSRRGLAVSRYVSVLISLAAASVVTMLVMAAMCLVWIGIAITPLNLFALVLGVFVEAAAFAGIVFVLSRVFRSYAKILGVAFVVYILTTFIPLLFRVPGSAMAVYNVVNPARYVAYAQSYVANVNVAGALSSGEALAHFNPASIGLTLPVLFAVAALWIVLPLGAFLYLSVKRD